MKCVLCGGGRLEAVDRKLVTRKTVITGIENGDVQYGESYSSENDTFRIECAGCGHIVASSEDELLAIHIIRIGLEIT